MESAVVEKADTSTQYADVSIPQLLNDYQGTSLYANLNQSCIKVKCNDLSKKNVLLDDFRRCLSKGERKWTQIKLTGNKGPYGLPEIFNSIPSSEIIQAAKHASVVNRQVILTLISLVLAVAAGVFTYAQAGVATSFIASLPFISKFPLYFGFAASIIIFYIAILLTGKIESKNKNHFAKLRGFIEKDSTSSAFDKLVLYVAEVILLILDRPVAFVISDYQKLDNFSKAVIQKITNPPQRPYFGTFLWIVFEDQNSVSLAETEEGFSKLAEQTFGGRVKEIKIG